ncbi:MAG: LAGLIDADG family homing endonuclease [Aestuariivirga sp.]
MSDTNHSVMDPISHDISAMKYRFTGEDRIEDSWRRVAKAAAEAEAKGDRARWEQAFYDILDGYRFLPAGRILSGAGTGRSVTLFNCFVMGAIDDSMVGIFDGLKEAALTMQQGGGIGHDFSTLRPKGAAVKGVGADASGPLSFMDVWDSMCRTIMSAGSRRGAMMGTMRCDHPDIEDFIDAKRDPRRLRNFNLSVLVTDAFMQAVRADADWPLIFNGDIFRTLKARALWDRIMRSTYDYAEPGVIFIDRINAANNLAFCETIHSTNPCVTGDTWVMTSDGPRQVQDLVGRPFVAVIDGNRFESGAKGFFATGRKPVYRLSTDRGFALTLTGNHPVLAVKGRSRWNRETEWITAEELGAGDEIVLNDHRELHSWLGKGTLDEGFLLGLLIGDGHLKTEKAVLSAWPLAAVVNGQQQSLTGTMRAAQEAAFKLPHRADFAGWFEISGRGEWRMASAPLRDLALFYGMSTRNKTITPAMEGASSDFAKGLIRGLLDTDGSVQGDHLKGASVRLSQSNLEILEACQRILLRLGITSTIYRNRRDAGFKSLPDGRGGMRDYPIKAQHELVIANEGMARFAREIGFSDAEKQIRLESILKSLKRSPNRDRFHARVVALEPAGEAEVFDVNIPGANRFDANGFVAHNCGEQPLPPYGACLLGSINLTRFVTHAFEPDAAIDEAALSGAVAVAIRFMDNVIDISNYPLKQQESEAKAKRRIGLGVTGLADALAMCGLVYGAKDAAEAAGQWMQVISEAAYTASAALAAEKGAFPLFDADRYLAGGHARELPKSVRTQIKKNGLRNGLLTSIAPTGTISLIAGNVSSGIEPIFSLAYERKVLMPDGTRRTERVEDYAARLWRSLKGEDAALPSAFVTVADLKPKDHLVMQAAVQRHVDSSISKTVNVPETFSFEEFKAVYDEAYSLGLKGCTTFRPNEVTGSVLSAETQTSKAGEIVYMKQPLERHEMLPGFTYKLKWADSDHAIYITVNDIVEGGRRRPFEIFINSKNMEHFAWTVALTRMISAVFRRGGDVSFVVEELKAVFDPRGGQWMEGRYVPSLLAAIGGIIERHLIEIGFLKPAEPPQLQLALTAGERPGVFCPRCGEPALVFREGCSTCMACGYSKCS